MTPEGPLHIPKLRVKSVSVFVQVRLHICEYLIFQEKLNEDLERKVWSWEEPAWGSGASSGCVCLALFLQLHFTYCRLQFSPLSI